MYKNKIFLLLFSVLSFCSYSCTTSRDVEHSFFELSYLRQGQSIFEFLDSYDESMFKALKIDKEDLYIYNKIEGCGEIKVFFYFINIHGSRKTCFMISFEDNNLLYWGTPEDYYKSDINKLNNIIKAAIDDYFEEVYNEIY